MAGRAAWRTRSASGGEDGQVKTKYATRPPVGAGTPGPVPVVCTGTWASVSCRPCGRARRPGSRSRPATLGASRLVGPMKTGNWPADALFNGFGSFTKPPPRSAGARTEREAATRLVTEANRGELLSCLTVSGLSPFPAQRLRFFTRLPHPSTQSAATGLMVSWRSPYGLGRICSNPHSLPCQFAMSPPPLTAMSPSPLTHSQGFHAGLLDTALLGEVSTRRLPKPNA